MSPGAPGDNQKHTPPIEHNVLETWESRTLPYPTKAGQQPGLLRCFGLFFVQGDSRARGALQRTWTRRGRLRGRRCFERSSRLICGVFDPIEARSRMFQAFAQ